MNGEMFADLPYYALHMVLVTLQDGSVSEGILNNFNEEFIEVDTQTISTEVIESIEYLGYITDFHTYNQRGEIDGEIYFTPEDCTDSLPMALYQYSEYICKIACRLTVRDKKTYATDIRLLEKRHRIYTDVLSGDRFLYFLRDGSCICGKLAQERDGFVLLEISGTSRQIAVADIERLTKCPDRNEEVNIILHDGAVKSGTVASVSDTMLSMIDQQGKGIMIRLEEVSAVRHFGKLTARETINEQYRCRAGYLRFRDESDQLLVGAEVSYEVGVNDHGLVAKDVVIEKSVELETGKGFIITMSQERNVGWIGKEYVIDIKAEKPRGNVTFARKLINFPTDGAHVYLVEYTLKPDRSGTPYGRGADGGQ